MDKKLIKEVITEMLMGGELSLKVDVTDGSELYFNEGNEKRIRVEVSLLDSKENVLTSGSDTMIIR